MRLNPDEQYKGTVAEHIDETWRETALRLRGAQRDFVAEYFASYLDLPERWGNPETALHSLVASKFWNHRRDHAS